MTMVWFAGGASGDWAVSDIRTIRGEPIPSCAALGVLEGDETAATATSAWILRGFTSNTRYATRDEVARLRQAQPQLGRADATRAALIPIRKTAAWWAMAQDERRAIFEDMSHHNGIGMEYLPAIARRLHHCRDLGEPFDFLTWFEFAPQDEPAFDKLVARLRATREWEFVDREIDIRLARIAR